VTTSTELTGTEPGKKRFNRASVVRGARRVGVIAVAAALATPLALPAFASSSDAGSQESLSALVARDAQQVSGVVTAGESTLADVRLEVQATTPAELEQIRSELQAAAEAERQQQEQEQAQAAASSSSSSRSNGSSNSSSSSGSSAAASSAGSVGVSGNAVANAALAQIGVAQDCTALVRKSIAAVGLGYSGMGNLFNLGPTIPMSAASPGDIIYYSNGGTGSAHVAIYIGGGRAVHGGWSGYNTVVAGVNIGGSAPVFIDIT
jgi:peptidoglycan DL-endopeptidase CwlO